MIDCNQATLDMYGFSTKEEAVGKAGFQFISARDYEKAIESMKTILEKGSARNIEYTLLTKDGKEFLVDVSASVIRDASGEPKYIVAITRDITQRRKMEAALRESEERLRQLIEFAPDAIYVNDLDGVLIDGNKQAEELTGYKKEELVGKNILNVGLIPEKSLPKIIESLQKNIQGLKSGPDEIEMVRKDGSIIIIEVSAIPVKRGEKIECLGIARNITERKQLMKKLEEYSQQLEEMVEKRTRQLKEAQEQLVKSERLTAIGQVAAMVGHDLRNPLTGIKGAAYYLKTKPALKTDKKTMEMLELIEKDIEYSNKIITDLLEYSREVHLELTETTPRSIVSETLSLLEVPKNVEIINLTQDEPRTKVDIEKLNRVFVNLIKNAFDAMPKGGKLTIKSIRTNDNVELAFTDTGMGMTKEQMGKIWTPFFTTKAKGMGLGLPICKRIVEAHGGHISVQSMAGLGTTFTVTIPIEPKITDGGEKIWMNIPESLSSTTMKPLEQS